MGDTNTVAAQAVSALCSGSLTTPPPALHEEQGPVICGLGFPRSYAWCQMVQEWVTVCSQSCSRVSFHFFYQLDQWVVFFVCWLPKMIFHQVYLKTWPISPSSVQRNRGTITSTHIGSVLGQPQQWLGTCLLRTRPPGMEDGEYEGLEQGLVFLASSWPSCWKPVDNTMALSVLVLDPLILGRCLCSALWQFWPNPSTPAKHLHQQCNHREPKPDSVLAENEINVGALIYHISCNTALSVFTDTQLTLSRILT